MDTQQVEMGDIIRNPQRASECQATNCPDMPSNGQFVERPQHVAQTGVDQSPQDQAAKIIGLEGEIKKRDHIITKKNVIIRGLKKEIAQLDKTVDELNAKLQKLNSTVKRLSRKNNTMKEIIQEQEKRLNIHENAHVPSSKQGPLNKNGTGSKSKRGYKRDKNSKSAHKKDTKKGSKSKPPSKRGGMLDHKGGTHIFHPTETKHHTADRCAHCQSANIERGKYTKRRIVSIPEFIPHTVTLHKTQRYTCLDCNAKFDADNGLPPYGQFDYSVIRLVTYLHRDRVTGEAIKEFLMDLYGVSISEETVNAICERGTRMLKPTQEKYLSELERARATIMDETDYEGEPKRWILAVRNHDTVVYMHAQNRSAKNLISQAKNCVGAITRDGYTGYDTIFPNNVKQRCTQHLTREAKNISKRTKLRSATKLYSELSEKFVMLRKWTRGRHSMKSRKEYVSKLQEWLRGIISRYKRSRNKMVRQYATTLENAAPQMFTFVTHAYIQSTTNLGEQSIRKVIGHRNSRIQLKSDKGAERLCVLLSCVETWKLRKLNVWNELCKAIAPRAS